MSLGTSGAAGEVTLGVEHVPEQDPPRAWVGGLTLANLAVFAGLYGPIQVLIALQALEIAPDSKEYVVGLVTAAGAVAATLGNPLAGALSDRTRSRFGRRWPWVLGGSVVAVLGLVTLSQTASVALMVVGWVVTQLGLNAIYAGITASVADQVPVRRRGEVGGWLGMAQTLGLVLGTAVAVMAGGVTAGYLACAGLALVLVVPFLLGRRDLRLVGAVPAFRLGAFLARFWVSPRTHPDFGWAWLTRWLVNLGNAIGTLYLLFYLQDAVGLADPAAGVLTLVGVYALCVVATAVLSGRWSDRVGRRKPFVALSAVLSGLGAGVLALSQTWPGAIVGAAIFGVAYGVFLSVDFALVTQVLPSSGDAARDLGVINIAAALPQVVAPVLAAPLVAAFASVNAGYAALYALSAAVSILGGVLVGRIRGVR
ncbi:MFS transporter [Pseudactinotalea suaedae]|uniref:MFS transporter n=1 Tax=Pseudactinotalea suaedae TaxID=1524924 RepID=UPI0012E0F9FE|nr:MFS transporter [Pseudactinotalea suaedae]